jgi:hypothetical protein
MSGIERVGKTLRARRERFLAALMASHSLVDAARTVGIAGTTARRWLAQPDVRERYHARRRETVESAMRHIQAITSEDVATVHQLLDQEMPPAIRLRAALGILKQAVKTMERTDILERLEKLEAAAARRVGSRLSPIG